MPIVLQLRRGRQVLPSCPRQAGRGVGEAAYGWRHACSPRQPPPVSPQADCLPAWLSGGAAPPHYLCIAPPRPACVAVLQSTPNSPRQSRRSSAVQWLRAQSCVTDKCISALQSAPLQYTPIYFTSPTRSCENGIPIHPVLFDKPPSATSAGGGLARMQTRGSAASPGTLL